MKRRYFIAAGFLALVLILSLLFLNSDNLKKEADRVNSISLSRELEIEDLKELEKLTKDDEHAKLFLEEAFWLLKNNQSDHANHPISFLVNYIKTGKKEICIPHELIHMKYYIESDEKELINKHLTIIEQYKEQWKSEAEKKKEKFPQYYKNFEQVLSSVGLSIERLRNKQYDNKTFKLIEFIDNYGIC
ncbi:hypothetical protein J4440_00930 [Candidatus Woesearchaeota archaeon]|nr:hypothetical protein [Candidatus Woesearchaeota archaeon]